MTLSHLKQKNPDSPPSPLQNKKSKPIGLLFLLRVTYEKDAKLKADELGQKRMIFYLSGFNFNDRSILYSADNKFCHLPKFSLLLNTRNLTYYF